VTFLEEEKVVELPAGGSSGRQLVPGLLLMADNTAGNYVHTPTKNSGEAQTQYPSAPFVCNSWLHLQSSYDLPDEEKILPMSGFQYSQ
jgi:hypothetical protein